MSPTLAGIENVVATATNAGVFNFANATGVTSVTNQNSSDTLTFSSIATTVAVAVANTADKDTTVVYSNVTGAADAATITLNNVTSSNLGGAGTRSDITAAGIETLTLNSTGAASQVNVIAANATRLNVTGTADLTVAGNDAATVVVNASTFTGALTVTGQTVTGGAGNDAITGGAAANESLSGGAGNDTITFASNFTNADTVAGGDGTADTLRLGTAADATGYTTPATRTVSGIEILRVDAALGADLTLSNIQAGIQQVRLTDGAGANRNITFDTAVAGTLRLDAAAGGQIALTSAGTGTTDTLTITNGAAAGMGASVDVFDGQIVGATGVETLVLNGSGNGTATTQDVAAITVTGTGTTATALNFVGSNAFVVANGSALTATTIDAAGLTGNATLNMGNIAAATATTINGSNNNSTGATPTGDVLIGRASASTTINANGGNDNVTGGTAADTLNGGDGNDTISGGGGNDVITGGAGNDQITIAAGNVNVDGGAGNDNVIVTGVTSADTIVGGADTDTLSIAAMLSAGDAVNISGFEIINASAAVLQDLVALTNSGNNTITTLGVSAATGTTSFSNAGAITDLNITADDNNGSIAMTRLLDNTSNAINLNLRGATGANASTYAAVALADEETIVLASGQASSTFNVANTNVITTLTAGDLTSLTVNGANDLTIGTLAAATGLATVNLQSSTGIVTINAASSTSALTLTSGSGTRSQTNFTSGSGNDNLTGTANDDTLIGGAGNDIINAGNGANSLEGGTGADTITGGTGVDTVNVAMQANGTHGADRVNLGAGLDVVNVTIAGTNQVRLTFTSADVGNGDALDGNNTAASTGIAYGGAEDGGLAVRFEQELTNVVTGEAGAAGTTVVARYDDEGIVFVSAANTADFDVRDLGTGTARGSFVNVVLGTDGNDTFTATSFAGGAATEAIYINAGAGDDNLTGSDVADFLVGGAGADVLTGGLGVDSLLGGAGADVFVYASEAASPASVAANTTSTFDNIFDFITATDKLRLDAVGGIDFAANATATRVALTVNNVADFSALGAALVMANGTVLLSVSTTTAAAVYDITLTGTGLAAAGYTHLVLVNDGTAALAATDLLIQLTGTSSTAIAAGDFQFV
ncbi:MAG: calcium-binding protein [Burkholderiaceae bacterium]|nr:calcium-binding protein [Burkholderiaceae bacterium]